MAPAVLVATFDAVRAYITRPCPLGCPAQLDLGCDACGGWGTVPALTTLTLPEPPPSPDQRDRAAEAWLTERHGPDWYIGDATERDWGYAYAALPALTVGLVLPAWDAAAAERIEQDTGWSVASDEQMDRLLVAVGFPAGRPGRQEFVTASKPGESPVVLPVESMVATATVTDVQPVQLHGFAYLRLLDDLSPSIGYVWHLADVAPRDPVPVTVPDGQTVWAAS
jgi:hypothetical protein